ncbi:MAG: bifunctional tetrahydrofolate synthase/dihydrofolate synthase [Glaciecola sp.]|jgi:dihydrofolate synthase / folylpolyglutamate synthase
MPTNNSDTPNTTWSLERWLAFLESIHTTEIDMGLARICQVYTRLNLDWSQQTVITVAGTNGKGTTCAMLERAATLYGQSVGVYCSPHIHLYNERVRVNHQILDDRAHCDAFHTVEQARGDISLTYFEFGTLAALVLLNRSNVDLVILEVGLGGRLDATNVVDPDVAVITSIGLDHQAFLGDTRELIAIEKAGIIRAGKPCVIGEIDPPTSLQTIPVELGATTKWAGRDFVHFVKNGQWCYRSSDFEVVTELPKIPMPNAATAIAVLQTLGWDMHTTLVQQLVAQTRLAGRLEIQTPTWRNPKQVPVMYDVAHNPQASEYLAKHLQAQTYRNIYAIFGAFKDKDLYGILQPIVPLCAAVYCITLEGPRAATADSITDLCKVHFPQVKCVSETDVESAYIAVLNTAQADDLVLVFGSFFTVNACQQLLA